MDPVQTSPQEQTLAKKGISAKNLTIYTAVGGVTVALLLAVLLNYFGVVPVSDVYPGLSFLPKKGTPVTGVLENAKTADLAPAGSGPIFAPGLTQASIGKLVDNYTVLYTLRGKVTKVESLGGGKYDVTVSAFDGSQTYKMDGVGGDGILKQANKPIDWKDLKEGSDVIVQLNVNSVKDSDKPQVVVAQIQVVASP